jgi:hypothetical protein
MSDAVTPLTPGVTRSTRCGFQRSITGACHAAVAWAPDLLARLVRVDRKSAGEVEMLLRVGDRVRVADCYHWGEARPGLSPRRRPKS